MNKLPGNPTQEQIREAIRQGLAGPRTQADLIRGEQLRRSFGDHDDEPTGEVLPMSDAQLLAAIRAERRLTDDMGRAMAAINQPSERSDDDA